MPTVPDTYSDFVEFDRVFPIRATAVLHIVSLEGFQHAAATVVQATGFQIAQNRPPRAASSPFYHGPSGLQGLVIGERGIVLDVARRKAATRILIPFLFALASTAGFVVLGAVFYPHSLIIPGGIALAALLLVGVSTYGQHRNAFDSQVIYLFYNAPALDKIQIEVPRGGLEGAHRNPFRLDLTVCAARIASENYSSKFGHGRRFLELLPAPNELKDLPTAVVRALSAGATPPLSDTTTNPSP